MTRQPNILIVVGTGECECLVKNLQALGRVVVASEIHAAMDWLRHGHFDVVFSAWDLEGGKWSDLLSAMDAEHLDIPAIIYYHCAGEAEWAQSLEGGAFDLVAPPFDQYKLSVVLEHVMASREPLPSVA